MQQIMTIYGEIVQNMKISCFLSIKIQLRKCGHWNWAPKSSEKNNIIMSKSGHVQQIIDTDELLFEFYNGVAPLLKF